MVREFVGNGMETCWKWYGNDTERGAEYVLFEEKIELGCSILTVFTLYR